MLAAALVLVSACGTGDPDPPGPQQLRYGDDPAQFGWLTMPSRASDQQLAPVVVLLHGGFWKEPWDYTLMSPLGETLSAEGYAVWNIEFRRVGGRGGWPTTFDDVGSAVDHVARLADSHPVDPAQVVLIGHSSGGHLALWSLGRDDAAIKPVGAIGLAPIVDLSLVDSAAELLGGLEVDVPDRYREAAPALDPDRVVVLHGADDTTIGPGHALAAVEAGVPVEHLADVDHFGIIEPDGPAWARLQAELDQMWEAAG